MSHEPTRPRDGARGQRGRSHSRTQSRSRSQNNGQSKNNRGTSLKARFEQCLERAQSAAQSGDEVEAEGHYQHAEHFFRLMNAGTA